MTEPTSSKRRRSPRPRKSSGYRFNLAEHGLTQSALRSWLECPEQHRLHYLLAWSAKGINDALGFGIMLHSMLERFAVTGEAVTAKTTLTQVFNLLDAGLVEELCGMADTLFPHYVKFWGKQHESIKWVDLERVFRTEMRCSASQSVLLTGRFDGIYDASKGTLGLFETKTKGQIHEDSIASGLHVDFQTMFYALCAQSFYGKPVSEVTYNVLRRPLLRRKQGEGLRAFLDRVDTDITARPEHYFKRWRATLTQHDLTQWQNRVLRPILRKYATWYDSVVDQDGRPKVNPWFNGDFESGSLMHYFNPDALSTVWGGESAYCAPIVHNDFSGLYIREHPYPELQ